MRFKRVKFQFKIKQILALVSSLEVIFNTEFVSMANLSFIYQYSLLFVLSHSTPYYNLVSCPQHYVFRPRDQTL